MLPYCIMDSQNQHSFSPKILQVFRPLVPSQIAFHSHPRIDSRQSGTDIRIGYLSASSHIFFVFYKMRLSPVIQTHIRVLRGDPSEIMSVAEW